MMTIEGSYVGTLDDLRELLALGQAGKVPPIPIEPRPADEASAALSDLKKRRESARAGGAATPSTLLTAGGHRGRTRARTKVRGDPSGATNGRGSAARMGPKIPKMGIALEVAGTPCFQKAKSGGERRDGATPSTIAIFRPARLIEVSSSGARSPGYRGCVQVLRRIFNFGQRRASTIALAPRRAEQRFRDSHGKMPSRKTGVRNSGSKTLVLISTVAEEDCGRTTRPSGRRAPGELHERSNSMRSHVTKSGRPPGSRV